MNPEKAITNADRSIFAEALKLEESGDLSEALQLLQKLADSGVSTAALHVKIGGILSDLGQVAEAEREFRLAVKQAPRWVPASLGLFHSLWDQDLQFDALEEAKRFTMLTGSDEYMEIVREINEKNRQDKDRCD